MSSEEPDVEGLQKELLRARFQVNQQLDRRCWLTRALRCCDLTVSHDLRLYSARNLEAIFSYQGDKAKIAEFLAKGEVRDYFQGINELCRKLSAIPDTHSETGWNLKFNSESSSANLFEDWKSFPDDSWSWSAGDGRISSIQKKEQFLISLPNLIGSWDEYRVEYFARAKASCADLSVIVGGGNTLINPYNYGSRPEDNGYSFSFGAYTNECSVIQRKFHAVSKIDTKIEAGKIYHCMAEKIGGRVRFYLDGLKVMDYVDPLPLAGPGNRYVSLYTCASQSEFWGVKVWSRPSVLDTSCRDRIEELRDANLQTASDPARFVEAHLLETKWDPPVYTVVFKDVTDTVTERIQAETERLERETLERANRELEKRVGERTERLECMNRTLKEEMETRRKLEKQLLHTQRIESIGRLAGGIAHDFNNLLMVILGRCELLLDNPAREEKDQKNVEEIKKTADRAAELTRQLLAFSRKQQVRLKSLNLNEVVRGVETMLHRLLGETITVSLNLHPELASVNADKGKMEQVIVNLAVNGRDAMAEGGALSIRTENVELDEAYVARHAGAILGPHVMLEVCDSGCGMKPEILEKVFDPFFTTKEVNKGTGLGLSSVYGIVKQHGGNIWAYSEFGRGTAFKLYFPQYGKVAESTVGPRPEVTRLGGQETVLVVEDESGVRQLVEEILCNHGYTVLSASHGADALKLSDRYNKPIDLLLSDMVMPGLDGPEVASKLRQCRPSMKVVFMSGYPENIANRNEKKAVRVEYLSKPFTQQTLTQKVRTVLDQTAEARPGS